MEGVIWCNSEEGKKDELGGKGESGDGPLLTEP